MRWTDLSFLKELFANDTNVGGLATWEDGKIERYGASVLISHFCEELPPGLLDDLEARLQMAEVAVDRIYARHLVVGPGKDDMPTLLRGLPDDGLAILVREHGLSYEVDFRGGYSCGLFLDQRANRRRLRERNPARVLNTFAYTCSFSVAGASIGAETVSLDIAKVALERGRRNFTHNGISLDGHRFIADDVLDVFPRLVRRGEKFDVIILDPPTFSRGRSGRPFRVERDLATLIDLAAQCSRPGAAILLSTNCTGLNTAGLRRLGASVVPRARFSCEDDLPDLSQHVSSTLWMELP
jgi:23S rRNA (cytosine1962-C5)-methyltransferase